MNFSHKTVKFREMPCLLGAALAEAHHGIHSFSSAVTSKPRRSLENSDLLDSKITVLSDQDDQGSKQPTELDA